MKSRSWLALGFGALITLLLLLGIGSTRRAKLIEQEIDAAYQDYFRVGQLVRTVPLQVYSAGLLMRDYLLEPAQPAGSPLPPELKELRRELTATLAELRERAASDDRGEIEKLRAEVDAYWQSFEPVFSWKPEQKATLSYWFLRQVILPRRTSVENLVDRVDALNRSQFERERLRLAASQKRLHDFLRQMTGFALGVGLLVAGAAIWWVSVLERRSERQLDQIRRGEAELRHLSHRLVDLQEQERKYLSRELHDAIGQMLTALGMTLTSIQSGAAHLANGFTEQIEDARRLNAEILRAVRDLAMGLRPSMLDDLGLVPALEWLGRDVTRRGNLPVHIRTDGNLDNLPESHRTCIFRVVQEALTNCLKHSKARDVRVLLHGGNSHISLTVQDNGVGFDPSLSAGDHIGLLGVAERIRELKGTFEIVSAPTKGAILKVRLPLPAEGSHG